jgi:hypothetical protein
MQYIGMRYLDLANKWLVYGRETIVPFSLFHHPAIIAIAYFVVQWDMSTAVKWLAVLLGSFLVTVGLIEVIKRRKVLRGLFGMKAQRRGT